MKANIIKENDKNKRITQLTFSHLGMGCVMTDRTSYLLGNSDLEYDFGYSSRNRGNEGRNLLTIDFEDIREIDYLIHLLQKFSQSCKGSIDMMWDAKWLDSRAERIKKEDE